MSGRAYARNPSGALGGATDIDSIVPHRFRIDTRKAVSKVKELAIRRAIQRRCKEKNWKKLLRLRHTRLTPLEPSAEEQPSAFENGAEKVEKPLDINAALIPLENGEHSEKNDTKDEAATANGVQENGADAVVLEIETPIVTVPQQVQEALDKAKQQLQEMEAKLATMSDEKHTKFQQLKDILMAEARSKMAPPIPKKRRVDSLGAVGTTSSSPHLMGGAGAAGFSLLGAPSPSLLRAQSFSGTTLGLTSTDTTVSKDTRQL